MRWLLPTGISSLALGALSYFDFEPVRNWRISERMPFSLLAGCGITLVLVMPLYAVADGIQRRLKLPIWTQPLIHFGMWLSVWLGFFLYDPKTSGVSSPGVALKAALEFWAMSLAFGIPWVLFVYQEARRRNAPTVYWK